MMTKPYDETLISNAKEQVSQSIPPTDDKLLIDGGATVNYFYSTARHRLTKIETGTFPLQLADESTTTINERGIFPNIGLTYTTMTYDEFHRNNGHLSRRARINLAKSCNISLTHQPSIRVDTNAWMLNPDKWQKAISHLNWVPTIDICVASKSKAQIPLFVGPKGVGVYTDWRDVDSLNEKAHGNPGMDGHLRTYRELRATPLHTLQINSTIEWQHATLNNLVRCLLLETGMSIPLWGIAKDFADTLRNCTPLKATQLSLRNASGINGLTRVLNTKINVTKGGGPASSWPCLLNTLATFGTMIGSSASKGTIRANQVASGQYGQTNEHQAASAVTLATNADNRVLG
ncbi:hypothetical protein SARC_09016 [Sphaeroforma arctica JP610]|uniref:Uncharacterized protein n=1 Tax=Sphaeroforma arctica JP610 TaxID=667725 RepID=A0A0L0FNZ2_9EUKA|nr:hypothetical protein SARC_09016 [Sphaeroforma arctica JP610]KNC78555.1 hypothetical protein SARC_09016 [Sphaeroforma arctica JP610]|eukprot:XP_014152457.1 hypothetical protein SARC_09016 [Sphaeroforma arctica JP610]